MKDMNEIRNFIQTRRPTDSLVLCTLVRKSGSSYRGVGAKKVVSLAGDALGFLSGGCLEASIEKTARERFNELPFIASFSTLSDEDRLLGYQTGCQGVIDILFENADAPDLDLLLPYGREEKYRFVRLSLDPKKLGERVPVSERGDDTNAIYEKWNTPVQVYVIGCGADADDYGPLIRAMGWSGVFLDYRASLMPAGRFAPHQAQTTAINDIGSHIPNGESVAVILMTHNYEADLEILRTLKDHRVGYLGCLGPAVRWRRLQTDLLNMHGERVGEALLNAAFAPAGVFTHGQSPEEIALSVIAQIQGRLIERPKNKNWTVILAAGASSRFGSSKALASLPSGETFLRRTLATAKEFSGKNVLVVTGAHELPLGELPHIHNPDWQKGMGTSIAAGILEVLRRDPKPGYVTLLPVDQPFVSANHLWTLSETARLTGRCALTSDANEMGPPASVPSQFFDAAISLKDDRGLKSVLNANEIVCVENKMAFQDFDRPTDLLP